MANKETSCSAGAESPGYSCSVGFDNYCEMVPNVTKGHWLIAMPHFFSIIENSHVLVAENISFQICFYLFNWRTTARQYCVGLHHTT